MLQKIDLLRLNSDLDLNEMQIAHVSAVGKVFTFKSSRPQSSAGTYPFGKMKQLEFGYTPLGKVLI